MGKDFKVPLLVAASMLLLALLPLPYGYYTLLRLFVTLVAGCSAFTAKANNQKVVMWIMCMVALLFNPVIPISLTREIWAPIDIVVAILMIVCALIKPKGVDQ